MKLSRLSHFGVVALLATGACSKGDADDKIKALTARVEKLEAAQQSFSDVAEFVAPIMQQQKAQQAAKAAQEPDPDTRFAVDIAGDAYDGPATAAVTIVEAFDFA